MAALLLVVAVGCAERTASLAPAAKAPPPAAETPAPHGASTAERDVAFNGYYAAVDASSPAALRRSLHMLIRGHQRHSYSKAWEILERADENPSDPNAILDLYKNTSYAKFGGGNGPYNREHTWPKSYGFPNDSSANYPYTDCHHLFLCNSNYNSSRGNKPYDTCDTGCQERPTDANDGQGGPNSPGTPHPGNSNWTQGSQSKGKWETWIGRRGDIARALLYLDVRYEGGTHTVTGVTEPDLVLTDDLALLKTGASQTAHMGRLSTLIQWHRDDPPDDKERRRNDIVQQYQGNRNPFIDFPDWVDCVFEGICD